MTQLAQPVQRRGVLVRAGIVALSLVGLGAVALVAAWWTSRPAEPDGFYAAPAQRPAEPGMLLRSEPFAKAIPARARAWRILYTTTRADNSPAIASAVVFTSAQPVSEPRPVIAWAHGTTGVAPGCARSVMIDPFAHVPALDAIVREGWVYVATDYVGLGTAGGHAYLVGEDAARSVLDAVRAARQLRDLRLDNRVVVWGHSQGGNSALWTGGRADYARDVNLMGIAALAPASDLRALATAGQASTFGRIVASYILHSYSAAYPDLDAYAYVHRRALPLVKDMANRCVGEWGTLFSIAETFLLPAGGVFIADPASGVMGEKLAQNTPQAPIAVPILIAQGASDDLVLPDIQQRYVAARCAARQPIDYRSYEGRDHLSLVAASSPLGDDIIAWTRERLAGRPATATCTQR